MTKYRLTEKENYLRMLHGEFPDFLPRYDMMGWTGMTSLDLGTLLPNGGRISPSGWSSSQFPMRRGRITGSGQIHTKGHNQVEGRYKGARPLRGGLGGLCR
jgi:hypothetical protein